jgi:proteasome lid subunit RPN8/RPN11
MHHRANHYVTRHAYRNADREIGGLLLGSVFRDPGDDLHYPVITHAIPARYAAEERGHLTFTHDTWRDLNRQREEHYPDKLVIGWYHTHPGLDIFLSQMDLFVHRNFFRQSWQVALVIDPHQDAGGFFVWSDGDLLDPQRPHQLFRIADLKDEPGDTRSRIRIKLGERAE